MLGPSLVAADAFFLLHFFHVAAPVLQRSTHRIFLVTGVCLESFLGAVDYGFGHIMLYEHATRRKWELNFIKV